MRLSCTANRCSLGWVLLAGAIVLAAGQPAVADDEPAQVPFNVFEGRVLDSTGQRPVAGARVVAVRAGQGFISYGGPDAVFTYAPDEKILFFFTKRNGRGSGKTITDAEGGFVIKGLKAGKYNLLVVHAQDGIIIIPDATQPNQGEPLEITLPPPTFVEGTIKGVVSEASWPSCHLSCEQKTPQVYADAWVALDRDGKFRTGPLLPDRKWTLTADRYVQKRNFFATLLKLPVEVETGKTNRVDVDLSGGLKVSGVVRGPKGEALDEVSVVARSKSEPVREYGTLTGSDGRYTIAGLSEGDYVLEAKRWARRTAPG